jgi:exo-beta-1,3-glucanase (GH17 family)
VLAVALGDEPLYDWDFGTAENLAKYIRNMRNTFKNAGHDIPLSISELAWGYQNAQQKGENIQAVIDAVDFLMINNFPYFSWQATTGGSSRSWGDFMKDMDWYESVAGGKTLVVTQASIFHLLISNITNAVCAQTGWPSNKNLYKPNSPNIVASPDSQRGFWGLLDSKCESYFKSKRVGWMWRAWDDTMDGWGVVTKLGGKKWDVGARTQC